jgi:hypothetical protein
MGLTADDLKKHPQLARALVAYHTILGVAAGPKELFAKGDEVEVPTTDPHYKLTFIKKPDGVYVRDFQVRGEFRGGGQCVLTLGTCVITALSPPADTTQPARRAAWEACI